MTTTTDRHYNHVGSPENPATISGTSLQRGRYRFLHNARMIGKTSLKITVALTAAAISAGGPRAAATGASATVGKPDIVYILADDMGYGDVSLLNPGDKIQTPSIDSIGRDGMVFTDAHAASAICTPSRYGLLTGRYPWRSRLKGGELWGLAPPLIEPGRMTVASFLKLQGYNTAMIGKWNLGLGWQYKKGEEPIIPSHVKQANTVYEPYQDSMHFSTMNLWHVDYGKPVLRGPLTNGFDFDYFIAGSADMPPWIYIRNDHPVGLATKPMTITKKLMGARMSRTGPAAPYYKLVNVLPDFTHQACAYIREQAAAKHPFFLYYAMPAPHTPIAVSPAFQGKSPLHFAYLDYCIETDAMVAKVLKAIHKADIAKNTLVIFTSDNGFAPYVDPTHFLEKHGDYPSYIYRGFKSDIWEGGTRVPFLVRWPAVVKAGTTCPDTICLTDLMATVSDILHVPLPGNAGEDSFSILPALKGGKISHPIITSAIDGSLAISDGRWKLEMCPGSGGWTLPNSKARQAHLPMEQLYNMKTWLGVTEQFNVVKQYPMVARRLRALLAQYIRDGRSTPGKSQQNDNPQVWSAINWIKSPGEPGTESTVKPPSKPP